jgi:triphosphoribosyl-dephospho-CoA synthase
VIPPSTGRDGPHGAVDDAILALLTEVAGTPKPGNVDRQRDLTDLHFESFLAGAVGARSGLTRAAHGGSVGHAFERAVAGMADRAETNTQFGCLLVLVPLLRATAAGDLSPSGTDRVTAATTVDDAVAFYRAFEHVDVAVADPPPDAAALDVRRGSAAEPVLRERGYSLRDVLALSAAPEGRTDVDHASADHDAKAERIPDRNAQEWVEGFPRTFRAAAWIATDTGPITDRAARAFLGLLATEPDTLVATAHGPTVARDATARARAVVEPGRERGSTNGGTDRRGDTPPTAAAVHDVDRAEAAALATAFVDEGINPGTTADLTCASLYVALRHGVSVGGKTSGGNA